MEGIFNGNINIYNSRDINSEYFKESCKKRGKPENIRVDNGPEFISKTLDFWAYQNEVRLQSSRPGKPIDNSFIELFNGSFWRECLETIWFLSLMDSKEKIESWRKDYNNFHPHSSLDY